MPGTLYLVGTPIGNLNDLSPRAAETFENVDFIAAEDTRVSVKLLNHLQIKKPLVSYYEHNRKESGEKIITRLLAGENCALVSDAGMPSISDPGEDLVSRCADFNINVVVVPGPCAAVCALALSGLPVGRFTFEGFLSTAKKSRFAHLESLKNEKRTMVFYEAPHKLIHTLQDMLSILGDRPIALCREITKLHEETFRCLLSEAIVHYTETPPRGEYVLVLSGTQEEEKTELTVEEAVSVVLSYCEEGFSMKDAVKRCSEETGISKNILYASAINAKN